MSSNPPIRTVEQVLATGYRIDSFSVLSRSWELVKAGLAPMLLLTLGGFIATGIIKAIFGDAWIGSFLISYFVWPVIMGALMVGTRRLMLGQPLLLADFKDVQPIIVSIIVVGILTSLLTTIGLILCILPGLYAIVVLGFALPFIIDRGTDPVQAIKDSVAISNKSLLDLIILLLVMGVVIFLGFLACGVGLFVAIPLVTAMRMVAYADVMGLAGTPSGGSGQMPVQSRESYPPPPPVAPGFAPPPSATPGVPPMAPPVKPVDPVDPFGDDDHKTPPPPPIDLPR
ncbi:hypothetical protein CVU37_14445 [candidate division BRC1 bacterium HGW-BRC1-1]|jgi:hypothetical protein|nr:MAG: hypothetical protein CVU37_14445 [candidate division BRC1 bacterium HGW-BRC1-1]